MEWQDQGIVLTARPHGESAAIAELFTASHGRHSGLVRGGSGRRMAPHLQPGTVLAVRWRARTPEQLGTYSVEPERSRAGLMSDPLALAGLSAVTALLSVALPERQPHPRLWQHSSALLDIIGRPGWTFHYLTWELALLDELGFGLDLESCALTGTQEDLAYVSPRTGRAVARGAAGEWAGRLLPLPPALLGRQDGPEGLLEGLVTTGHFLRRHLEEHRLLPEARSRLVGLLSAPPRAKD